MSNPTVDNPSADSEIDSWTMWQRLVRIERDLSELVSEADLEWVNLARGEDVGEQTLDQAVLSVFATLSESLPAIGASIDRAHGLLTGEIVPSEAIDPVLSAEVIVHLAASSVGQIADE
jgi:hypothetical protein